jgi:hypothetical protein
VLRRISGVVGGVRWRIGRWEGRAVTQRAVSLHIGIALASLFAVRGGRAWLCATFVRRKYLRTRVICAMSHCISTLARNISIGVYVAFISTA